MGEVHLPLLPTEKEKKMSTTTGFPLDTSTTPDSKPTTTLQEIEELVHRIYPSLDAKEAILALLDSACTARAHILSLAEERSSLRRRVKTLEAGLESAVIELRLAKAGPDTVRYYTNVKENTL
jgi:hypothetical protein